MLAHQGGWDEALFVAVPMLVFFLLLRVAKRRADAESQADADRAVVDHPTDRP